jgi:hypothetical protein
MEHTAIILPDPKSIETYAVVAMSTGHLTEQDRDALIEAARNTDENMVMERDTGFFVKLMGPDSDHDLRHGHSENLLRIIRWASSAGFGMIEFDRDAPAISCFDFFDW